MTRSSEDIEHEVEQTRMELDETVEALKAKMSPGQVIDEITQSLKGSGVGDIFGSLGAQVKENPMALAMIGAGMAWLMMGKGGSADRAAGGGQDYSGSPSYDDMASPSYGDRASDGGGDPLADIKEGAADVVGRVSEAASHLKDQVAGSAGHLKHAAQAGGAAAAHAGHDLQRGFMDALEREPLVIGALGLAVGVAVGAALPATRLEDRTFGAVRDRLVDEGTARASDLLDEGKDVAHAAIDGARDAAREEGLVGQSDGGTLVEKAETVVRAGVDAAKDRLEEHQPR